MPATIKDVKKFLTLNPGITHREKILEMFSKSGDDVVIPADELGWILGDSTTKFVSGLDCVTI